MQKKYCCLVSWKNYLLILQHQAEDVSSVREDQYTLALSVIFHNYLLTINWIQHIHTLLKSAFSIVLCVDMYKYYSLRWICHFELCLLNFKEKVIYIYIYFIEVQLIHNVVLISAIQQCDSVICIYTFCIFFSIMVYHRVLNIVPCAVQ